MIPFHEPVTLITVALAVVLWAGVAALRACGGRERRRCLEGLDGNADGDGGDHHHHRRTVAPGGNGKVGDYQGKIAKGKVDGEKISFEVNIEPGTITYEGTIAGDEMKLTVTGTTGNKMTLVAKRQK